MTNTENQRAFKERMYAAGYKQKVVWVAREKQEHLTRAVFLRRLDRLTAGWSSGSLSELFNTVISMVEVKRRAPKEKETT
jgi:hypothetical protein